MKKITLAATVAWFLGSGLLATADHHKHSWFDLQNCAGGGLQGMSEEGIPAADIGLTAEIIDEDMNSWNELQAYAVTRHVQMPVQGLELLAGDQGLLPDG